MTRRTPRGYRTSATVEDVVDLGGLRGTACVEGIGQIAHDAPDLPEALADAVIVVMVHVHDASTGTNPGPVLYALRLDADDIEAIALNAAEARAAVRLQ